MKHTNSLAELTGINKARAFNCACKNSEFAYTDNNTKIPLEYTKLADVEFIGGLWRVQRKCKFVIQDVHDKSFVVGTEIKTTIPGNVIYYNAAQVAENCYGLFIGNYNFVLAKYNGPDGAFWAYGTSVKSAQAFLYTKLYAQFFEKNTFSKIK